MLIQDYSYYLLRIMLDAIATLPGVLAIVLFAGALALAMGFKQLKAGLRITGIWGMLLAGVVSYMIAFYSTTYEFEENAELLVFDTLPEGEPDCGTAWTKLRKAGYGINNPCPRGCYRGLVLRKQMTMTGFPPWPNYNRELQCWRRD